MAGRDTPPPARDGSSGLARSMREAQPYIDAVWQFLASVALMTWLGWWADGRWGTRPWLLVVGALSGFAAGAWAFIKVLMVRSRMNRGGRQDEDAPR